MSSLGGLPAQIGKYEVLGVIGRGGMGVVYSARDPFIDRIVAVKTIRISAGNDLEEDQAERLRMEARSAGKLHHPNIVTIFDFGELGDLSYIVMEYVEGVNLSRVVQQKRPVPLAAKLEILMQVSRGLAYAHECGVVHRDMKPSNVCVTTRGVAKILDFGLARFDNTKLTKTGYLSGTIAYMSPERFNGETGPLDDLFALGAVAYEFLANQRAFPGDSTPQIIAKILGGPMPAPLSELTGYPSGLDAIVLRALDRDPQARYATAAEFERALEQFSHSDEYLDFAAEERLDPQFQKPIDWTDDMVPAAQNPYSSAKSMESMAIAETPTLQIPGDDPSSLKTEVTRPAGEPTILATKRSEAKTEMMPSPRLAATASAAPTQIMVSPVAKKTPWIPIAAVVVIIAIAGGALFLRKQPEIPQQAPPIEHTAQPPATATVEVNDPGSRQSDVELAKAVTLAGLVAKRNLSPEEATRYQEATARLDQARARIAQKDYAGGAQLATAATTTLSQLLATSPPRSGPAREPAPKPGKTAGKGRGIGAPPGSPMPLGKPVPPGEMHPQVPEPPTPALHREPAPAPAPAPVPRTSRGELEHEIQAFVREVGNAYQDKDVSFFRQHALSFSDQQANAIRNSPSTGVQISVQKIDWIDDQNASVSVQRTDTFAERNIPSGVQTLTYELRRTPAGWKIVSFHRG